MTYKIKRSKGRPKADFKVRGIKGFTPKGFIFHKIHKNKKAIVFKREK